MWGSILRSQTPDHRHISHRDNEDPQNLNYGPTIRLARMRNKASTEVGESQNQKVWIIDLIKVINFIINKSLIDKLNWR